MGREAPLSVGKPVESHKGLSSLNTINQSSSQSESKRNVGAEEAQGYSTSSSQGATS